MAHLFKPRRRCVPSFGSLALASVRHAPAIYRNNVALTILPALIEKRVGNIEAAYSGYGDSGCIDGVQYRDEAGVRVDRASLPAPVIEQLENVLYEFLPSGFEINDGGQGTLTINTQTAKVTIQHQENYTETRDSTREFEL